MTRYIYYGAMILELILSIVLFCSNRAIANQKRKSDAQSSKDILLSNIKVGLPTFIAEAEELYGAGHGMAKLTYVLNKVHIKCLELSLPYNENELRTQIEAILETPQKKEIYNETT